jgi:hypothetical protein
MTCNNLTVARLHTYHVHAGDEEQVLVHNASCKIVNKNNFIRIGKTPDGQRRVSIGAQKKHWDAMSPSRQRLQRFHLHLERRKGGLTDNKTGRTIWKYGDWK